MEWEKTLNTYDMIIIGGGVAGLSAGIYAMRSRLNTVLVERFTPGGQMMVVDHIENYPGFPNGIVGADLSAAMEQQARGLGLEIISADVTSVDFSGHDKVVTTPDGELQAQTIILATGATPRRLGIPGEDRLLGKGVSYCATCDGTLFSDKEIAVIGGGNSAIQDATFLARFASKVTVIHRRDELRAVKILQERIFKNPKIEIIWDSVATEIQGENKVQSIAIENVKDGSCLVLPAEGVFVLIGTAPNADFLRGHVILDPDGYIITDEDMLTNVMGVFAAGDCRRKSLRQMVTAAADGAIAAMSAEQYIESLKDRSL